MNQEIKDKLEQAAKEYFSGDGSDELSPFKAGARTILDNPQEWGLETSSEALRGSNRVLSALLKNVELRAQLSRYRTALERAYNDFKSSRWTEETYKIVIEALKNNEG